MGWLDSGFGDWFGSDFSLGGDTGGGGSFNWGGSVSDWLSNDYGFGGQDSGGDSSSGGFNWGSLLGGSGSGGGSSNIFGALLSGLASGAGSWLDSKNAEKAMKQKGVQDRKTLAFGADLEDYYKQKDKARKRVALDTYGQFSQLSKYAPNYTNTPAVEVPTKPNPGGY